MVWRFDIFDINIVLTFEFGHFFTTLKTAIFNKVDYIVLILNQHNFELYFSIITVILCT